MAISTHRSSAAAPSPWCRRCGTAAARSPGGRARTPPPAAPRGAAAAGTVPAAGDRNQMMVSFISIYCSPHLLLGLLHQGLVREDRLELVAGDGDDEHPEEDGLHDEEDAVQDAGLLHADVLT